MRIPCWLDVEFVLHRPPRPTRRYLLLHGYAERGEKMFNRIASLLPPDGEIIAPSGPFPLPGRFPLSEQRDEQQFVKSFAWYFYDKAAQHFFIDYTIPSRLLRNLIIELDELPLTIIGYSQGGYLSLFAACEIPQCDHIIGINSSWREDKLHPDASLKKLRVDSINGEKDKIVDPVYARKRHERLLAKGATGTFHSIKGGEHRWGKEYGEKLQKICG